MESGQREQQGVPLYVDLDGTLLRGDMFGESLAALARCRPWALPRMPCWLMRGRAVTKGKLARLVRIEPSLLPYRPTVVDYLRQQRAVGRRVVLATATHSILARPVAEHLGLFDAVLASDDQVNLKGARKLEAIRCDLASHGYGEFFAYLGDAPADAPIWAAASEPMAVDARASVVRQLRQRRGDAAKVLPVHEGGLGARVTSLLRAMRPHQWAKNLLLFVPLALSHQFDQMGSLLATLLAVLAFSLCASSVYLLNDVLDLAADRRHPSKRHRPIASGQVGVGGAWGLATALCAAAFGLAVLLPAPFVGVLAVYWVSTSAYSLGLKRLPVVDVVMLAGLYTLRLWAGGAAAGVWISPWLVAFSVCIFVSLALLKRYIELRVAAHTGLADPAAVGLFGRGYDMRDRRPIAWAGMGSGAASAVVMAMYVNSPAVRELYASPGWLLWVCPLLLTWIGRIWWLAHADRVADDPVVYALRDWSGYVIGAAILAVGVAATVGF